MAMVSDFTFNGCIMSALFLIIISINNDHYHPDLWALNCFLLNNAH